MLGALFRSWAGLVLGVLVVCAAGLAAWLFLRAPSIVDPVAAWHEKGSVAIGVRADSLPFSGQDETKAFVGYEPDIGRAIAAALEVEPQFIAVDTTNALAFLERGVVDFVLLPRDGLDVLNPAIKTVDPGYFASGLSVVALNGTAPEGWEALAGTSVCGLENGPPARQLVDELGGTFIEFNNSQTALQALTAERCLVFIDDEVSLTTMVMGGAENEFVMPFETIDVTPWTVAVRVEDEALNAFVTSQLIGFHRSGYLIDQAQTWNLPTSLYLKGMQDLFGKDEAPLTGEIEEKAGPG